MAGTPLPDFLELNGSPDPRAPRPPDPETLIPSSCQSPGSGTPKSILPRIPGSLEFGEGGTPFPGRIKIPKPPSMPENPNFPKIEIPGEKFEDPQSILANPNKPDPLPGGLITTPSLEDDEIYSRLSPDLKAFFRVLEKTGTPTKAAKVAGVRRTAMEKLRKTNPDIEALWQTCMQHRAEIFEDEAIRRGVKGVMEPVYYMGAICGYKRVYSDSLLSKVLEGNMPEKYRSNHKIELEGKLAVATLVLPATTSAEEWAKQNRGTIINQEPEDEYK